MPCPTGSFKIISRGKGQSCMASCAYYAGEKKYSEYECCWKYPHSSPARVKRVEVIDMRSLERQGVEDRLPQKHLGPTASALERKGVSSERGDENRKIISVNKVLASLQKTVRGIGAWLDELRKAVSRQQTIESPDDYPLSDVITAYLDMRKDGRETWNRYAQEKGAVHDLKDGFKAVSFLSNHELYTVGQLGQYIAETQRTFSKIKAESTAKELRIRDIDALFGAIQTIRELKPIQQEYEGIHWNSKREKYKAEHGDELNRLQKAIWLREKLVKSLGLASPLDKEQRAALKTERARLEAERETLLPKLEEVKNELTELNRIRYWTRKVIPDALPRVSDGRVSIEDAMETAGNRKELEQVANDAVKSALRQSNDAHQTNKSVPIHLSAI